MNKVILLVTLVFQIVTSITLFLAGRCIIIEENIQDEIFDFKPDRTCSEIVFDNVNLLVIPKNLFNDNPEANSINIQHSNVKNLNLSNIPGASALNIINILSSKISIKSNSLANLTNLNTVIFRNVIFEKIEGHPFKDLPNLIELKISDSNLTKEFIENFQLSPSVSAFKCLNCSIDDQILPQIIEGLNMLTDVDLSFNLIETYVYSKAFRNLILTSNRLTGHFNSSETSILKIRNNNITSIFIHPAIMIVLASNNSISEIMCNNNSEIIKLDLNNNKLSKFGCITLMTNLKNLYINSNNFTYFDQTWFTNLTKLEAIHALRNPLQAYPPDMFAGYENNQIRNINVDKFDYGHINLKKLYPNLLEILFLNFHIKCDEWKANLRALNSQNIIYFFNEAINCKIS